MTGKDLKVGFVDKLYHRREYFLHKWSKRMQCLHLVTKVYKGKLGNMLRQNSGKAAEKMNLHKLDIFNNVKLLCLLCYGMGSFYWNIWHISEKNPFILFVPHYKRASSTPLLQNTLGAGTVHVIRMVITKMSCFCLRPSSTDFCGFEWMPWIWAIVSIIFNI